MGVLAPPAVQERRRRLGIRRSALAEELGEAGRGCPTHSGPPHPVRQASRGLLARWPRRRRRPLPLPLGGAREGEGAQPALTADACSQPRRVGPVVIRCGLDGTGRLRRWRRQWRRPRLRHTSPHPQRLRPPLPRPTTPLPTTRRPRPRRRLRQTPTPTAASRRTRRAARAVRRPRAAHALAPGAAGAAGPAAATGARARAPGAGRAAARPAPQPACAKHWAALFSAVQPEGARPCRPPPHRPLAPRATPMTLQGP